MASGFIRPETPPEVPIPEDGEVCALSIIDTTCSLTVPADTLVEPVIPGHELMNFPTVAFLITHAPSGRKLLFDLGCRKDFWNLPPPIAKTIDEKVPGIKVEKSLADILSEGGTDVSELEAAIVSHHHYDHMGEPKSFPPAMDLIVGPGFSDSFLPGYPTAAVSPVYEDDLAGRRVREITFEEHLTVAGYRAVDYFSDGSLYILDTPGHAIGHLSALVRTTKDTFVFLGADICHFGGSFRPTPHVPMPSELSSRDLCREEEDPPKTYSASLFTCLHPRPDMGRTCPFYEPCSRADSWYVDPQRARESISRLKALDANERILVVIAHDPAVMNVLPFYPRHELNGWYEARWKDKLRWGFLDELPVGGKPREYLVSGTYVEGKLVKTLSGEVLSSS
ncbi:hypothetical protein VUR80DRAFT_7746 [Thermomyces stellatus]